MNTTTSCTDPVSPLGSMDQQFPVVRPWNGTPISRRSTEGDVHATALGKANGKQCSRYRESDRCQSELEALFQDIACSNLLTASAGLRPGTPADEELSLSDAWLEGMQEMGPRTEDCSAGMLVTEACRDGFGQEPPLRQQDSDVASRLVKSHRRSWLIETLKRFCCPLAGG